jgi:hypothetical protein
MKISDWRLLDWSLLTPTLECGMVSSELTTNCGLSTDDFPSIDLAGLDASDPSSKPSVLDLLSLSLSSLDVSLGMTARNPTPNVNDH